MRSRLKPKNKGYMNFYECCDSTKKYILGPLDSMFLHSISDFIVSFFLHLPWHFTYSVFMNHDIKYKLQKYIMRWSKNINNAELFCIELYTRKTGENLLQKKILVFSSIQCWPWKCACDVASSFTLWYYNNCRYLTTTLFYFDVK